MAVRFPLPLLLLLLLVCFFCHFTEIKAHKYEDPTIKTMEDFSGYPLHEPQSSSFPNSATSLSVDTQSLQKQIDELSTFSDTPAPSVTRILYSEKDVLARRYMCIQSRGDCEYIKLCVISNENKSPSVLPSPKIKKSPSVHLALQI